MKYLPRHKASLVLRCLLDVMSIRATARVAEYALDGGEAGQ